MKIIKLNIYGVVSTITSFILAIFMFMAVNGFQSTINSEAFQNNLMSQLSQMNLSLDQLGVSQSEFFTILHQTLIGMLVYVVFIFVLDLIGIALNKPKAFLIAFILLIPVFLLSVFTNVILFMIALAIQLMMHYRAYKFEQSSTIGNNPFTNEYTTNNPNPTTVIDIYKDTPRETWQDHVSYDARSKYINGFLSRAQQEKYSEHLNRKKKVVNPSEKVEQSKDKEEDEYISNE